MNETLPTTQETCDLLVHNARLLTVDKRDTVVHGGALAVRDGLIVAVGEDETVKRQFVARTAVDANGGVVHPGFIDAHVHVSQYIARSIRPVLAANALTQGHWKEHVRPEDEHASATLAAIDYLKCGYTGFIDPGTIFDPDAVAPVADEVGIRIWLTDPYVGDRGRQLGETLGHLSSAGFLARWTADFDEALERLGSQLFRNDRPDSLVRAFVGIYGEGTESIALHRAALERAQSAGVQFQMHLCYLPSAHLEREKQLGTSLYRYYADKGLLNAGVTFIHMNVVRPDEVELLAEHGVAVVWCPFGQMHMIGEGGAAPRMAALQRAGVPVGLGTDIPWVINFDDLASLAIAASSTVGDTISAQNALRALTQGGAAAVGASGATGSLEPGKYADFVIRHSSPSGDYGFDVTLESAVHGSRETVRSVYVAGNLVYHAGETVRIDRGRAIERSKAAAHEIAARVGIL